MDIHDQINQIPQADEIKCNHHFILFPNIIQLSIESADGSVSIQIKLDLRECSKIESTFTHTYLSFQSFNRLIIIHHNCTDLNQHFYSYMPVHAKETFQNVIRYNTGNARLNFTFDSSLRNCVIHTFQNPSLPSFYQYCLQLTSNTSPFNQYTVDEIADLFQLVCDKKLRIFNEIETPINFQRRIIHCIIDSESHAFNLDHLYYFRDQIINTPYLNTFNSTFGHLLQPLPEDDLPPYF